MKAHETKNDRVVHLVKESWEVEEEEIITDEYKDSSNNDMHIREAIGLGDDSTMSVVARKLGITAGSLTTSVNSLVNKKYVVRERSESDRRVVYIRLTEKGRKAFYHHKDFHTQMTDAVIQSLDENEIPVLLKTLKGLSKFFRGYKEER